MQNTNCMQNTILYAEHNTLCRTQYCMQNTILYADDQILMATSEDDLQTMAYHLKLIARKYKVTISSTKTKLIAMWGNHIQKVKIVINNNIIEMVTDFKYPGYCISAYKK
jgi:hypothetical protein